MRIGITILIAESVSGLLKQEIGRDRPPIADPDPSTLVPLPHTSSFPSGHATVSFACATILGMLLAILADVVIGGSRVIGDNDPIKVHPHERFTAIDRDDNS